jgi:acyl carrier protein
MWLKTVRYPDALTGPDVLNRLRIRLPGPMRGAELDTLLSDLPLDSLDMVELLCLIDDEFGLRFEEGELQRFRTVGHLADRIAGAARQTREMAKDA